MYRGTLSICDAALKIDSTLRMKILSVSFSNFHFRAYPVVARLLSGNPGILRPMHYKRHIKAFENIAVIR